MYLLFSNNAFPNSYFALSLLFLSNGIHKTNKLWSLQFHGEWDIFASFLSPCFYLKIKYINSNWSFGMGHSYQAIYLLSVEWGKESSNIPYFCNHLPISIFMNLFKSIRTGNSIIFSTPIFPEFAQIWTGVDKVLEVENHT